MTREIIIPGVADDGSLFPIEKMQAHMSGQQHLAVSVFVFSQRGLLIQQRAETKYHSPGQWANTCCSHPNWQEDPAAAAARRLREEMGFSVPLKPTTVIDYRADVGGGLIENERVHVFKGEADAGALVPEPDPDEVAGFRWVAVDELEALLRNHRSSLCPWFRIYIERWPELRL